jgi:hypothetical protein
MTQPKTRETRPVLRIKLDRPTRLQGPEGTARPAATVKVVM